MSEAVAACSGAPPATEVELDALGWDARAWASAPLGMARLGSKRREAEEKERCRREDQECARRGHPGGAEDTGPPSYRASGRAQEIQRQTCIIVLQQNTADSAINMHHTT
eukprot:10634114-Heterocapsa_arctica.AAC.1